MRLRGAKNFANAKSAETGNPVLRFGEDSLEVRAWVGLLSGLGDEARKLLRLMREGFHLLTGELALDVESFLQVLRMNEALSKLEIGLKVGFGVLNRLLVDLAGAGGNHVGRFGDRILSLARSLDKAIVRLAGLIDALAGEVADRGGNLEINLLVHDGILDAGSILRKRQTLDYVPQLPYRSVYGALQHKFGALHNFVKSALRPALAAFSTNITGPVRSSLAFRSEHRPFAASWASMA